MRDPSDVQLDREWREDQQEDKQAHLDHMTDGRWHDDCHWCLQRRRQGGAGLPESGEETHE